MPLCHWWQRWQEATVLPSFSTGLRIEIFNRAPLHVSPPVEAGGALSGSSNCARSSPLPV